MKSAYNEGSGARLAGNDATDVPYRQTTEKWFDWLDGWKDQDQRLRARDQRSAATSLLKTIGWIP